MIHTPSDKLIGGGLGMTHNRPDTYPRLATIVGSVGPGDLLRATQAVIGFQRDHGNRADRKRARLKYVLDDSGAKTVVALLANEYGLTLAPPLAMPPLEVPDLLGWHEQGERRSAERSRGPAPIRSSHRSKTCRSPTSRSHGAEVDGLLAEYGVVRAEHLTPLRRWSLACPALPTCGLALTEAERVRAPIVAAVQSVLDGLGLSGERISLRITGCPNGCARSYAGDIDLVGRIPGHFAIYVGGDFEGTVLAEELLNRVKQAEIAPTLAPLFGQWAQSRGPVEAFGDWCRRQGTAALRAMVDARRAA